MFTSAFLTVVSDLQLSSFNRNEKYKYCVFSLKINWLRKKDKTATGDEHTDHQLEANLKQSGADETM